METTEQQLDTTSYPRMCIHPHMTDCDHYNYYNDLDYYYYNFVTIVAMISTSSTIIAIIT